MRELRIPDRDLVAELIVEPDPYLGSPEGTQPFSRPEPRHLRLYVAGWMLSDGTPDGDRRGMREAYALYDGSGTGLLDRARLLTTADIVAEVLQLLELADR